MPKMFLLFSHTLTPSQEKEAKETLKCEKCIPLPKVLQKKWEDVNPIGELNESIINVFVEYLSSHSNKGDYVLIQGDYGVTYALVKWCNNNGRIPVYSTTERKTKDEKLKDGTIKKVSEFKHINFRRYPE